MIKSGKILILLVALIALLWVGAANPFNFFVCRSENFSMGKFLSIRPEMRLEDAIAKLGPPIKVVPLQSALECTECTAYYFLGDPPPWLLSFREAWLLVDPQGRIVTTIVHSEP